MERNANDSKLHLLQLIVLWTAAVIFFMHAARSAAQNLTEYRIDSTVTVPSGTTMTIENSHITYAPGMKGIGISVENDATLIIKDSFLDLSVLPVSQEEKLAINAKENAEVIFDNTEISGADDFTPLGYLGCYGCSMTFRNGSSLRNNRNTGYPLGGGIYHGNIIYMGGFCSLTVEDSSISDNRTYSNNNHAYGMISLYGGAGSFTFKNAVISGNHIEGGALFSMNAPDKLLIENTLFENNTSTKNGIFFSEELESVTIGEGTVFRNNIAETGSCLYVKNTTVEIGDNVEFSGNISKTGGGAICVEGSDVTIGKSIFENNSNPSQMAGAIRQDGGSLTLNGTVFRKNSTQTFGGAIFTTGQDALLTINDAEFVENSSNFNGGAIAVAVAKAVIHKAGFINNTSASGGAIAIIFGGKMDIKNLLITENSAAKGTALGNSGNLYIYGRKGAMIFANNSGDAPAGFQDISGSASSVLPFNIDDRMFNGGKYNWNTLSPEEKNVIFMGASPANKNTEGVSVIMTGNTSQQSGGAIANDGTLIIGEESVSFPVRKTFLSPNAPDMVHPGPQAFADSLVILADGVPYELGPARQLEKEDLADGKTRYLFSYTEDVSVYLDLVDNGDNSFDMTVGGLPVGADGTAVVYTLEETMEGYNTSITGNMTEGFTITNTIIPKPTPTPTPTQIPTEVPTPTPTEQPGMNFYRLPEILESLPGTGF